jgi:hypothetical protein
METLYEKASLILNPGVYDSGKVYATKPFDGSGDLTFTRASNATRVASNGLIEKVRTNVLLQSNSFNTWTASNATVTSGQAGYDGTNTAWLIKGDTTTSRHNVFRSNSLAGEQTLSIYAKAGGHSFLQIAMAMTVDQYANFDLSTGTIGNAGSDFFNAQITSVGNGWYRISALTLSPGNIYISLVSSNTAGWLESWAMPNNTDGVLIMNGQLEAGVLTEFIGNTTTAAVSVGPVSGLPRLDYLNSSCPRLLLEPQRSNLMLQSENLNTSWTPIRAIATSNAATSPDGYASADKLIADTDTNTTHLFFQNKVSAAAGTYAYSAFFKKAEYDFGAVRIATDSDTKRFGAVVNLNTGAITATDSFGSPTGTSTKVEDYGNGWYRLIVTCVHASGDILAATTLSPTAVPTFSNSLPSFTGDNTSGVFTWGAALELGAYATSYIPTLGTSVTRVRDAASKAGISSLIGQTEGTIFWDLEVDIAVASANEGIVYLDNGSGFGTNIWIYKGGGGTIDATMYNGGFVQASFIKSGITAGRYKCAVAYANNNSAFFINGVQIGTTDTSCTIPAMSRFMMGATPVSNDISLTNQVLLFTTRLTNAQLAELTTL